MMAKGAIIMNTKFFGFLALAAAGVAVLALACGGEGDGREGAIRVEKGLVAAGAFPGGGAAGGATGGGESQIAVPPVPIPAPGAATGKGADFSFDRLQLVPGGFSLQGGGEGINVQGFGSATAPASTARLQLFVVGGEGFYPKPIECPPGEPCPGMPPPQPTPLAQADLAPIVEAIKAQGVAEADIEVTLNPDGYYDPYGPGRASITVTISDPQDRVQPIADAARDAAETGNLFLESVNVLYSVSPEVCATMERESMLAAVEDARDRAQLLAQVLGVGIGNVVFASHYSYSPFGPSPCDATALAYPEFYGGYSDPTQPAEATLTSNVMVTFAIQ
jgi:uncharacterized protein YggE